MSDGAARVATLEDALAAARREAAAAATSARRLHAARIGTEALRREAVAAALANADAQRDAAEARLARE